MRSLLLKLFFIHFEKSSFDLGQGAPACKSGTFEVGAGRWGVPNHPSYVDLRASLSYTMLLTESQKNLYIPCGILEKKNALGTPA